MDELKGVTRFFPGVSWIHKKLDINIIKPKETMFFVNIIRQAIQLRRESGERRNDMIDLMIDCTKDPDSAASKENVEKDQYEQDMTFSHVRKGKEVFDEDTIVATAMVMLVAGYDTTGMTLSFMAYYLAKHPEVQAKLQQEVDEVFEDNDGKMPDYNAVQALPYLEMCLQETIRLSSLGGMTVRTCNRPYNIPGTHVHLRVNDMVVIPNAGIHRDERYYPNPWQYNPENFSKGIKWI